jgi:DNA-binding XRE family transcriptional regulator
MRGKTLDYYEKWQRDGLLDKKLKDIHNWINDGITQKEVAKLLGMSEKTMYKLKNRYPKMNQAFVFANDDLKYLLLDTMIKKATGYEYEESQTTIEETKSGTKKRIVKYKKKAQPDMKAIRYLLIIKFGRDFNEKKEEIEALYERIRNKEENWSNASSDEGSK